MPMSIAHRTARISLRSASRLANLLRHVVFESLRGDSMVCFIHTRISIQPWVVHNPVDEVVHNDSDVVYATEPIVEGGCVLGLHGFYLLLKPISLTYRFPQRSD